jgi:hypothetical protein
MGEHTAQDTPISRAVASQHMWDSSETRARSFVWSCSGNYWTHLSHQT